MGDVGWDQGRGSRTELALGETGRAEHRNAAWDQCPPAVRAIHSSATDKSPLGVGPLPRHSPDSLGLMEIGRAHV